MLQTLLDEAALEFKRPEQIPGILEWCQGLRVGGKPFDLDGHPWQAEILATKSPFVILQKSTQGGGSTVMQMKATYGLISGLYQSSFISAWPTADGSVSFSKTRFEPFISDNPQIKKFVTSTDSATVKRIGRGYLLFVGGQLTLSTADGLQRSSASLLSSPADAYSVDELDKFPARSLDLLDERLSHSEVQHRFFVSTPSIEGYGINALFSQSDGRLCMIKCRACNEYTNLEDEFPNSVLQLSDGRYIRSCKKCCSEIFIEDGQWVPLFPDRKEKTGYRLSRLSTKYAQLDKIMQMYAEGNNLSRVYNDILGLPYTPAESRLTVSDIYQNCGQELMSTTHSGPAAIGLDIGKLIHCVVAIRPNEKTLKLIYLARVSSFEDVANICRRLNIQSAVADWQPETRAVREWQSSMSFPVYLADYTATKSGTIFDEAGKRVRANRTECLDNVHHCLTTPGKIVLPRKCAEVEEFAKECINSARMIEEDNLGNRSFVWKKLGDDHFFHAMSYCLLASQRIGVYEDESSGNWALRRLQRLAEEREQNSYNPLTFGLRVKS